MLRRPGRFYAQLLLILMLCTFQGSIRFYSRKLIDVGGKQVYRDYDPRGAAVEATKKLSEKEFFRLRSKFAVPFPWPGLNAMNFSFTWLKILSSTYDEASVEGDFSWLFHKLKFISLLLPKDDQTFQTAMLPFFVVLGKDPAGALYLFNEKMGQGRGDSDWRVAYWAGFHALENLNEKKLAGDLFLKAARQPGAPRHLGVIGFRLAQGEDFNRVDMRHEALRKVDPKILEKIKLLRPEWFE